MPSTLCLNVDALIERGLEPTNAEKIVSQAAALDPSLSAPERWRKITCDVLIPAHPFEVHRYVHERVFADWDTKTGPAPAWFPDKTDCTNIAWLMRTVGVGTYDDLYEWSIRRRSAFWDTMIKRLGVRLRKSYASVLDETNGPEHARWLTGA